MTDEKHFLKIPLPNPGLVATWSVGIFMYTFIWLAFYGLIALASKPVTGFVDIAFLSVCAFVFWWQWRSFANKGKNNERY